MAQDEQNSKRSTARSSITTISRWPTSRKIFLRRRKLPTLRLGGSKPRRGHTLVRLFRRMKLRWLKLQYSCMLRKLKDYYKNLIKDLIEADKSLESFQQRLIMEASFSVPVGISFSS